MALPNFFGGKLGDRDGQASVKKKFPFVCPSSNHYSYDSNTPRARARSPRIGEDGQANVKKIIPFFCPSSSIPIHGPSVAWLWNGAHKNQKPKTKNPRSWLQLHPLNLNHPPSHALSISISSSPPPPPRNQLCIGRWQLVVVAIGTTSPHTQLQQSVEALWKPIHIEIATPIDIEIDIEHFICLGIRFNIFIVSISSTSDPHNLYHQQQR